MNTFIPLLAVSSGSSTLSGVDWLMIALYFGVLLCVAWWVIRKSKDTAADYFLAGRNLGWWIVGASIFASKTFTVAVRYPSWVAPGALTFQVNGAAVPVHGQPGSRRSGRGPGRRAMS